MRDDCRPGSPEQRIKRFLDGCAYLLLRDAPEGTLTKHEERKHERYEISVSSCPAWVSGLIDAGSYSPRGNSDEEEACFRCLLDRLDERAPERLREKERPNRHAETRFQRLQKIRTEYPGCFIHVAAVDTDNRFCHGGQVYCISAEAGQYAPRQTREGELYDMDRVLVVEHEGKPALFLDQSAYAIAPEHVRLCEEK